MFWKCIVDQVHQVSMTQRFCKYDEKLCPEIWISCARSGRKCWGKFESHWTIYQVLLVESQVPTTQQPSYAVWHKRDHIDNNGFTAWHRFWKSCWLLNLYSHTFRPTSFDERALTVVNHTLTFEVELGVRVTCGKIWRVIGASGHVSTQFTFSMLYFSIACVAQSTASCCMSSLMSAFLMTALRSVILSVFCCLLLDLEAARD